MWSSWNQALQAGCLVSACAVALMMMSLNETLPWSPSCLFRASRASLARSMSTSVVRKKWGMGPREVASRFAMVLRIWVSGTSAYAAPVGSGGATRETGDGSAAAGGDATGCRGCGSWRGTDGLARRDDHRHHAPDRNGLALGGGHLAQHAVRARHQIHHGLVGLDLGQRLARLHRVPVAFVPFHHAPLLHRRGE